MPQLKCLNPDNEKYSSHSMITQKKELPISVGGFFGKAVIFYE